MKKGAIFDMDGLLFDTELVYNNEWYKLANAYGLTIHPDMLNKLRGTNGDLMHQIVNSYWPDADAAALTDELFVNAEETLRQSVPVKNGAIELLNFFKEKGVKMAIASSAPLALILNNLKVANIQSYFEAIVSGEQVVHGKPAPDIFLLAANKLSLDPLECYVLEDGLHGVYAGLRAGCATIMVPDFVPPTEELYKKCAGIYPSLHEVMLAMIQYKC